MTNSLSMPAYLRRLAIASALALGASLGPWQSAVAQPPPLGATMQSCSMSARLLTITLLDSLSGKPIDQAAVRFVRKSDGVPLHTGSRITKTPGQWVFLEDGEVSREEARLGLRGVLVVERAGRPAARRDLTVELDSAGCHLVFKGTQTIRL